MHCFELIIIIIIIIIILIMMLVQHVHCVRGGGKPATDCSSVRWRMITKHWIDDKYLIAWPVQLIPFFEMMIQQSRGMPRGVLDSIIYMSCARITISAYTYNIGVYNPKGNRTGLSGRARWRETTRDAIDTRMQMFVRSSANGPLWIGSRAARPTLLRLWLIRA